MLAAQLGSRCRYRSRKYGWTEHEILLSNTKAPSDALVASNTFTSCVGGKRPENSGLAATVELPFDQVRLHIATIVR